MPKNNFNLTILIVPPTFVCRIVNLFRGPLALVLWVIDHRRFPLAVHLIIPVIRFGRFRIGDVLGLVPVLRFLVIRIRDRRTVIPVLRFLGLRVLDFLRRKEVPVRFQFATFDLRMENFRVQQCMCSIYIISHFIHLTRNIINHGFYFEIHLLLTFSPSICTSYVLSGLMINV